MSRFRNNLLQSVANCILLMIDNKGVRWNTQRTIKSQGYTMLCKITQGCASNYFTKISDNTNQWASSASIVSNVGMNGTIGRISTAYPINEQGNTSGNLYENEYDITDLTRICDDDYPVDGKHYTNSVITVTIDGVSTKISDQYTFAIQGYTSMYKDGIGVVNDYPTAGGIYTTDMPSTVEVVE